MKKLLFASMMCLGLPTLASARPAQCYLEIDALVVIDGACNFHAFGGDGSFQVSTPDESYVASVSVIRPGRGEGRWNRDRWTTHINVPLGTLFRDDACWRNDFATVCAW